MLPTVGPGHRGGVGCYEGSFLRRPRKWGLRALAMIPAAHELQQTPASALRSKFLQVGLAMARALEEEWESPDSHCCAAVARANCHQLLGSHTSPFLGERCPGRHPRSPGYKRSEASKPVGSLIFTPIGAQTSSQDVIQGSRFFSAGALHNESLLIPVHCEKSHIFFVVISGRIPGFSALVRFCWSQEVPCFREMAGIGEGFGLRY